MKQESLDALLIDRALGELSPEVTELLEEYLVLDRKAAADAHVFDETLAQAKAAAMRDVAPPAQALPRLSLEVASAKRQWFTWPQWAAVATCLLVGIVLGYQLKAPTSSGQNEAQVSQTITSSENDSRAVRSELWSLSRIAEANRNQTPKNPVRYRISWDTKSLKTHVEETQ